MQRLAWDKGPILSLCKSKLLIALANLGSSAIDQVEGVEAFAIVGHDRDKVIH